MTFDRIILTKREREREMPLIHGSTVVTSWHPFSKLPRRTALSEAGEGTLELLEEGDIYLTRSAFPSGEMAYRVSIFSGASGNGGGTLVCSGDQLVMTWDNGPYGWKRADALVPGPGGDSVMWSSDFRSMPCDCSPMYFVADDDDDPQRPQWIRRGVGSVSAVPPEGDFFDVLFEEWSDGADIGPPDDTPRRNTYVASGYLLHNGQGGWGAPQENISD